MMKQIIYGLGLLASIYLNPAWSHAVVTHTTLKTESLVANQAASIEINFNSKVEVKLSQILLVRAGDVKEPVNAYPGQQPGIVKVDLPALPSGEYALQLRIFAADGHLSEDLIRFFVPAE
jgi:methionine-rich copper-binding protein CopC